MEDGLMYPNNAQNDEIDLIDLIKTLWAGKRILIAWIVICVSSVAIYLYLTKPVYRIQSVISAPQASNLIPLQPSALGDEEIRSVPSLSEEDIYNSVLLQLPSIDVLREFWSVPAVQESTKKSQLRLKTFVDGLKVEATNPKETELSSRNISIDFQEPALGVEMLNLYLSFLNQRVQKKTAEDMIKGLEASIKAIDSKISTLEDNGQKNLSYELIKLRENYEIAKSLKISMTPYKDLENIDLKIFDGRDYLLGTDALLLEINTKSARQGKSLRPFDDRINDLFLMRDVIESDIQRITSVDESVPMFRIERKAQSSLDPVSPRRAIFLMCGMIVGLIGGALHVLLKHAFKVHG